MEIHIKSFKELSIYELYMLLQLRSEIFVLEQNCVYQDMDGKDAEALHVIGKKDENIVAYTRIFSGGQYFKNASIGRIAVSTNFRKQGYGHIIVAASIQYILENFQEQVIEISAQEHLVKFYETHGFVSTKNTYLEDGIPHVRMLRK